MAGLNQLYLAWEIAMQALEDHDEISSLINVDDEAEAAAEYWARSQPALANAFGLAQQAMEMALKGRIAAISPFLLISRDPKEWPKGVDAQPVPFSEFRTIDAVDLVKVHNTFSIVPLDGHFVNFWNDVRRDRNRIMHSVSRKTVEAIALVRTVLTAAETLFAEWTWPQMLIQMMAEGKHAAYGLDDGTPNVVMRQMEVALRHLTPADARRFFGFELGRHAYLCPVCYSAADRELQDIWPKLAQFEVRKPGSTQLRCALCDETTPVTRERCANEDCPGDVIHDSMCLTCLRDQDDLDLFVSGLKEESVSAGLSYDFEFGCGIYGSGGRTGHDSRKLPGDDTAREHARRAMLSPRLSVWERVTVSESVERGVAFSQMNFSRRLVGTWSRLGGELIWRPHLDAAGDAG